MFRGGPDGRPVTDQEAFTKDLLQDLATMSPVRCDEAAWRFLGLSLAGWNVLISLALAAYAAWAAHQGSSSVSQ